jgi:hypothetical protein
VPRVGALAAGLADAMRFGFLYDRRKRIFAIGYRPADTSGPGQPDGSFYDLLASEARPPPASGGDFKGRRPAASLVPSPDDP